MSTPEGTGGPQVYPLPRASPNARFLNETSPSSIDDRSHAGPAMSLSLGTHLAGLFVFLLLAGGRTAVPIAPIVETIDSPTIWVRLGPDGGGSGDGDRTPAPPRTAKLRGGRAITAAAAPSRLETRPDPGETTEVQQRIVLPVQPLASDLRDLPGLVRATSIDDTLSQGPGIGDAGGSSGPGSGDGPGLDRGPGSGTGDGPGGPGRVTAPQLTRQVKPEYTNEAMRAKVQGVVALEAVVLPDGTVGEVRIVRSLDRVFGLDQQAMKAVRQWRFVPGTRHGKPLPVIVAIELTFAVR